MNTKGSVNVIRKGSPIHARLTAQIIKNLNKAGVPELLAQLVQELQNVDENAADATLNATSILDSDGKRIELAKGPTVHRIIKE